MIRDNIYYLFISKLDILLAICGLIMGLGLTFIVYPAASQVLILDIGISLLIISPIYLFYSSKIGISNIFKQTNHQLDPLYYSRSVSLLSEIIFWVCFIGSFWALLNSIDVRPPLYFILIALAASTIAVSLFANRGRFHSIVEIIKILALGLNLRLSVYLFRSGNGGSGGDFFQHMAGNNILSQTGNLDFMGLATRTMNKEISFPLMHIQTAIMDIVTNLPIKFSTFLAISIPLLIASISIYLVTREIFDDRTAVLATLILSVCDYVILWGFGPTTTSFGLCIFYFSMYCMAKIWNSNKKTLWISFFLLFSLSLIFTHAVSSYVMFVTLIAISLGSILYNKYYNDSKYDKFVLILPIIYTIIMILFWNYAYYSISSTFFGRISEGLVDTINIGMGLFQTVSSTIASGGFGEPVFTAFISQFSYVIIFIFSIMALYLLCNKNLVSKNGLCILSAYLLLQFVTYIFPILGMRNIIPDRWFAFIWFFSSILIAFTIIYLVKMHGKLIVKIVPIVVIIFTFSMITGAIANDDSPFISKEYRAANSYTFAEMQTGETLDSYLIDDQLVTDYYYMRQFKFENLELKTIDLTYNDILAIREGSTPTEFFNKLLIYRNSMLSSGIRIYWLSSDAIQERIIKIVPGLDFKTQLEKYSEIYDIGAVNAYLM